MEITKLIVLISAFICGTSAVPLVRERRQNVIYGTTYTAPYSSYYGMPMQGQDTACFQRRLMSEPSWTKPVCNPDGSFREFQCEAYSRFKCWCVYSNGMMIPGSAVDFKDDPIREGPKMNCAAKRAGAPKPAPNPPPPKTPFQDPSIGWQLAYRDAAIKNNPFIPIYGYPGAYLANSHSDTVTVPESVMPSSSYTGCPDPCVPPCSCVSGSYRGVLPHTSKPLAVMPLAVNPLPVKPLPVKPLPIKPLPVKPLPVKPLPVKPLAVADKKEQEKREEEPVDEDSENKAPSEEDEEEEEEDESEQDKKEGDNDKETAENEEIDEEENEENDNDEDEKEQEAEPTKKEDEPKKDEKPVTKADIKITKITPGKKDVTESKDVFETKKNDANTSTKAQEAKTNIDGIDEEDEEDD